MSMKMRASTRWCVRHKSTDYGNQFYLRMTLHVKGMGMNYLISSEDTGSPFTMFTVHHWILEFDERLPCLKWKDVLLLEVLLTGSVNTTGYWLNIDSILAQPMTV